MTHPIKHGGNLQQARELFGEPTDGWQDLSTGISPWAYPAPAVPARVWQRLPEDNITLESAAAAYYGAAIECLLPLPGSQFAIARIPHLLVPARVAMPQTGYQEHQQAWQRAGHSVVFYHDNGELEQLASSGAVEHLVVINPNNPTGELLDLPCIQRLSAALGGQGVLLLDEAFMDVNPDHSAAALLPALPNLLILRSLGKFFGLAGLRLGFLMGTGLMETGATNSVHGKILQALAAELAPWGISHPAQWLGSLALEDRQWQAYQRLRILQTASQLTELLTGFCHHHSNTNIEVTNAGLFVTLRGDHDFLYRLYQTLGKSGIYSRWCHLPRPAVSSPAYRHPEPNSLSRSWLRLGLPDDGGAGLRRVISCES